MMHDNEVRGNHSFKSFKEVLYFDQKITRLTLTVKPKKNTNS